MEYDVDNKLLQYIGGLSHRWSEAAIIPRTAVSIGDWHPSIKKCHDNVTYWVTQNPKHKCVRGWMLMDLRMAGLLGQAPRIELLAHSIIQDENGTCFDITPVTAIYGTPGEYPFLAHIGTKEEYENIISQYNLSRIRMYGVGEVDRITYASI